MAFNIEILETGKYYEFTKNEIPVLACYVIQGGYPQLIKSADGTEITLVAEPENVPGGNIIEITEEKFNEYQRGFNIV